MTYYVVLICRRCHQTFKIQRAEAKHWLKCPCGGTRCEK